MKIFLILFCTFTVLAGITVFAYNSDKGPAQQKDGIAELQQPPNDSMIKRGEELVLKTNYSDQDLQAVYVYLKSR